MPTFFLSYFCFSVCLLVLVSVFHFMFASLRESLYHVSPLMLVKYQNSVLLNICLRGNNSKESRRKKSHSAVCKHFFIYPVFGKIPCF